MSDRSGEKAAIRCEILRGGFSDERIFRIKVNGDTYMGTASRRYCWNEQNRMLQEDEPTASHIITGTVAARVLETKPPGRVLVSIPDGEVIEVSEQELVARPG